MSLPFPFLLATRLILASEPRTRPGRPDDQIVHGNLMLSLASKDFSRGSQPNQQLYLSQYVMQETPTARHRHVATQIYATSRS